MKGFYCLTWRLTDAIDPKMSYIAKVAWSDAGKYTSSEKVYREYAERNYGPAAAAAITKIINQNEPFASDWGECMPTPPFAEPGATAGYLLNMATFSVHPKDVKGVPLVAANSTQQNGTKNVPGGHLFNRLDTPTARDSRAEIWRFLARHLAPPRPSPPE
jgi:hypothetical protein